MFFIVFSKTRQVSVRMFTYSGKLFLKKYSKNDFGSFLAGAGGGVTGLVEAVAAVSWRPQNFP